MNAFGELTDKEFTKLKKDIEKKMVELEELQKLHIKETGVKHQMPFYLSTPVHLNSLLPTVTCDVCGDKNTHQELEVNHGRCVNCSTKIKIK